MKAFFVCLICSIFLFSGCTALKSRIKGGSMTYESATGSKYIANQSEDPKDKSSVSSEGERTSELFLPPGSVLQMDTPVISVDLKTKKPVTNVIPVKITLATNAYYKTTIKDKINSTAGAAQKNTLGETVAKLASLKWITFVGLAMVLFGGASLFWLPLKTIVASTTTSLMIVGGGFLLIILPTVLVGNEILIFSVIAGGVILYFFTYRYAGKSKEAKIYKVWHDDNKNNQVDEGEIR